MALTLYLLRHAKAKRDEPGIADIDRSLNGRGRVAADLTGLHMAKTDIVPELVLCSPAERTRATWAIVAVHLPGAGPVIICPELYDFGDGRALAKSLAGRGGHAASILLVGHNPAISALALRLAAKGDEKLRANLAEAYPTCALATLSLEISSWVEIEGARGTLLGFVRPRDLV